MSNQDSDSNSAKSRKPNAALIEAKRRGRLLKIQQKMARGGDATKQENDVVDIYQNAANAKDLIRKPTGLIYDTSMSKQFCLWDSKHPDIPEYPKHFIHILQRCEELQLITRCHKLETRVATRDEILLLHGSEDFEKFSSDHMNSRTLESIYLHQVGSTIELIERIWQGEVQNGMAVVPSPGHQAMKNELKDYCFCDYVAMATKHALDVLKLSKVLIVNWDVHHDQGTQRFFYSDPRVLYFSIHRLKNGTHLPNRQEFDFDAIGEAAGSGFSFNIPLNHTGIGNADYLAISQQVLLPVALEYKPEMIIISAGYNAALGCPEGEMDVTPAFYAHLITPLLTLANSRIAVILEDTSCLESLAEAAALTLRALLGDPCPNLVENPGAPCIEIQDTILNCIYVHRPFWRCLQLQQTYTMEDLNNLDPPEVAFHKVTRSPNPARDTASGISTEVTLQQMAYFKNLKLHTRLLFPKDRTCYAYDELMLQHENLLNSDHPEQPKRIKMIYDMHGEYNLLQRMQRVKPRVATTEEICLVHTPAHTDFIRFLKETEEDCKELGNKYNSVYFHPKTFMAAALAAGSVLNVVDYVLSGNCLNGVCIVRPPGHHAEADAPHGFCIFNNIAIAAEYALRNHDVERVLIVDWDVHHGNGTQHIFESNPNVLYISVHLYENGTFFPKGPDGDFNVVGKGEGIGFNVNIPWNKKGMGDFEYALVFQQMIMPIAYEFDPELVLVSAGFDAAIGDPLGGCKVSPEAYGLFTHWLSALAGGRIILCLEGGYNIHSISYAMTMCTKALLGDPVPTIQINSIDINQPATVSNLSCIETLQNCWAVQSFYWNSLAFNRKLPKSSDFPTATTNKICPESIECKGTAGDINGNEPECPGKPSSKEPKLKVPKLAKHSKKLGSRELFAVIPSKKCPHLRQLEIARAPTFIESTDTLQCGACSSQKENWICLSCNAIFCGRYINEHMLQHSIKENHPLALSFTDLSVWCYSCEVYIDNRRLYHYKNVVYRYKFDEDLPWTYKKLKPKSKRTSTKVTHSQTKDGGSLNDDDDSDNELLKTVNNKEPKDCSKDAKPNE